MKKAYSHRSIRLAGYDYSQNGAYFITICTKMRIPLFGEIIDGEMILNDCGNVVISSWRDIIKHFSNVGIDEFTVMPDHIHGIIVLDRGTACRAENEDIKDFNNDSITENDLKNDETNNHNIDSGTAIIDSGTACRAPTNSFNSFGKPISGSLSTVIRSFKSAVTKQINEIRNTPGDPVWQRNYYEHIIRNELELSRIREYIKNNPLRWTIERDENYHE